MPKNIFFVVVFMAAITSVLFFFPVDTSESGPLEHTQNLVLILAIFAWLAVFLRLRHDPESGDFHPIFAAFFVCVVYAVLGRELTWLRVEGLSRHASKVIEQTSVVILFSILLFMLYVWIFRISNRTQVFKMFWQSHSGCYAVAFENTADRSGSFHSIFIDVYCLASRSGHVDFAL